MHLVEKSAIQAILAVVLTILVVALVLLGRQIPQELWALLMLAWGFYFGATLTTNNRTKKG